MRGSFELRTNSVNESEISFAHAEFLDYLLGWSSEKIHIPLETRVGLDSNFHPDFSIRVINLTPLFTH